MDRDTIERNKTPTAPDHAGGEAAALWRFSLALYARPGIAEALIALQDRAGLDVNLILFGLWAGACHGIDLGSDRFAAAAEAAADMTDRVRSIRALRRQFGAAADNDVRHLRRALLRLELDAERQVQRRFAVWLATGIPPRVPGDRYSTARGNLARCLGSESDSREAATLLRELAALMRHP